MLYSIGDMLLYRIQTSEDHEPLAYDQFVYLVARIGREYADFSIMNLVFTVCDKSEATHYELINLETGETINWPKFMVEDRKQPLFNKVQ